MMTCDFSKKEALKRTEDIKLQQRIDSLLGLMTLEEKIGQLNLPSAGDITTGLKESSDLIKKIKDGKVGGLFNISSVEKIRNIQRIAVEESRLKIPLLFGMDVIHGYRTTFPIPLGLSSSWDMDLINKTAKMAAKEATADGINWVFSPMVDISRDPRWGRIAEGSGEDPYLGSKVAKAMVEGYQGERLSDKNTVLACVKHFALYGASEAGRDYNTVDMSKVRMYNEYFPPYKAAIDAEVGSVMASFNEVDGIPATGSNWLLTEVLRNQWNFKGFVLSDYTGVNEMIDHGLGDLQTVSKLALKAGCDMDMVGEGFLTTLEKSLEKGEITLEEIEDSVKRILAAKFKLGLFDDPFRYCDITRAEKEIYTTENRAFARKVAAESMVLLKNDNQQLPLAKKGTVAVIGPLADNVLNMAGTWSVAAIQENSVSVFEGIKEVAGDIVKINYAKGSNLDYDLELEKRATMFGKSIPRDGRSDEKLINEAISIANKSDVVIAVVGESAEMSGESSSRTDLKIPKAQRDLLKKLGETGKPIVIVLFTGRPLDLTEQHLDKNISSILNVWFPGSEAGLSIADILFGNRNPSGKLTVTFPRNIGQIPIYYNSKNTGRPITNNNGKFEKFKSNYLDIRNEPLYPFGYGLSYTSFKYSNLKLSAQQITQTESISISVDVTNTGQYDGKEIVQLYIQDVVGSITRPVKELKRFKKIKVISGKTETVTFSIDIEDLKFYNYDLDFVAEPGDFDLFVGKNASDTVLSSEFKLMN